MGVLHSSTPFFFTVNKVRTKDGKVGDFRQEGGFL